jgi:hypothetical protein
MAIVKEKKDNNICGQGCGETRNFIHYWWECKNGSTTMEKSLAVSQ